MINNTLIGADGVVMTLSGRLEITSDTDPYWAVDCGPAPERTIIEALPGVGVPKQRIVLNGLRILDVETLQLIDYNNYPMRQIANDENVATAFREAFRGPGGKA